MDVLFWLWWRHRGLGLLVPWLGRARFILVGGTCEKLCHKIGVGGQQRLERLLQLLLRRFRRLAGFRLRSGHLFDLEARSFVTRTVRRRWWRLAAMTLSRTLGNFDYDLVRDLAAFMGAVGGT